MARHIFKLIVLLLLVFPASAFSDDAGAPGTGGMTTDDFLPAQHFRLKPELFFYGGYRFAGTVESRRGGEYDYQHSSPAGGLSLHYYPLPARFDLDFDFKNQYDYDASVEINYSDMLKLDYRNTTLFHNLEHYKFPFVGGVDTDRRAEYGVKVRDNDLTLVIKSPGRPYHVYVNLREYTKDGTVQQRDFFNTSRSRATDWATRELTAGINGNVLGLFELDYHHTIKTFDSDLRPYLVDAGQAHNFNPDLETNLDSISIHSDQSKAFAAAATVNWGNKKNNFSGARVDFQREYGDLTYKPLDNLFIAVKYGHQKLDVQNPDFIAARPPFYALPVKVNNDSISTTRNRGVVAVRYYPVSSLLLQGQYELDSVDRTNEDQWTQVADLNVTKAGSITHKGTLSATFTPIKRAKIRAGMTYSRCGDPDRNVDFSNKYEGFVWGSWVPVPGLTLNAQYNLLRGNNPVRSALTNTQPLETRDRDEEKDSAGAGVTWFAMKGLVVGAHYDYMRHKVTENLLYDTPTVYSYNTPYCDTSHLYTVFANYCFEFPLSVEFNFSQSWSKGAYSLQDNLFGIPVGAGTATTGLARLTDQRIRETRGQFKANYEIYKGWGTAVSYGISQFSDLLDREYASGRDGIAHSGSVMLTKKW